MNATREICARKMALVAMYIKTTSTKGYITEIDVEKKRISFLRFFTN